MSFDVQRSITADRHHIRSEGQDDTIPVLERDVLGRGLVKGQLEITGCVLLNAHARIGWLRLGERRDHGLES